MKKISILIMLMGIILVLIVAVGLGSINIDPSISYKILINHFFTDFYTKNWNDSLEIIIMEVRLPRVLLAFVTGASMSMIGVLMQTLTKNNLAEPFILGISSGASAGAVSVIILSTVFTLFSKISVSQGAFIGALLSTFIVFSMTIFRYSSLRTNLILVGVGVSSFFAALTNFIIYSSTNNSQVITAMFWMSGSLSSATKDILLKPYLLSLIILFINILIANELDIFLLGENTARSLGVNTKFMKIYVIICSTLLVSSIVSLTGIIGFVGLIIPHISRKIIGHKHKNLIIFSYFLGGVFLVLADTFARTIFAPEEIPIGIVTAFIGAPTFLFIIKKEYLRGESSK
ncbi:MAG: iron ABC transporter permease [Fusobacterium gastrosuis]|uniref:FecCD family ABC transporter permease n=1 Tax=Fusobacterium gastrosuis TaxID=1755100 RepID=UPI002A8B8EED|nr:iron ABC transporter permease [Fusobacterium gastrosuis]